MLNYGNYGIFLIMGHAGFCPSAVVSASIRGVDPVPDTTRDYVDYVVPVYPGLWY